MVDMNVARIAYATAKQQHASDKVMLALFEAGLVESNFTNHKTATDHDSLGYLQQRPSQGWPNPTNVATATKSFVTKAQAIEKQYKSAGDLAAAVQRPAAQYRSRYGQREAEAQNLIKKVSGSSADLKVESVVSQEEDSGTPVFSWPFKFGLIMSGVGLVLIGVIAIARGQSVKSTVGQGKRLAKTVTKSVGV